MYMSLDTPCDYPITLSGRYLGAPEIPPLWVSFSPISGAHYPWIVYTKRNSSLSHPDQCHLPYLGNLSLYVVLPTKKMVTTLSTTAVSAAILVSSYSDGFLESIQAYVFSWCQLSSIKSYRGDIFTRFAPLLVPGSTAYQSYRQPSH